MKILGLEIRRAGCAETVRDAELRCGRCRKWKQDDEFSRDRARINRRERGRLCKDCDRQRVHGKRAKFCLSCGAKTNPTNKTKTGLCRRCYLDQGLGAQLARRAAQIHTEAAVIRDVDKALKGAA